MAPILSSLVRQIQSTLRTNQRGYITELEMNDLIDGAQQSLQNLLVGLQQPQPQSKMPILTDQVTSDVASMLRPFIISKAGTLASGLWTFGATPAALKEDNYITDSGERVRLPNDGRLNSFLKSKIRQPSTTNYVGEWVSATELRVTPVPTTLTLKGIAPAPVTNVIFDVNFNIDSDASTEILWGQRAVQYLLYYALKQYGISVNSPFLVQIAAQLQSAAV